MIKHFSQRNADEYAEVRRENIIKSARKQKHFSQRNADEYAEVRRENIIK
jgi:hypothetical protein